MNRSASRLSLCGAIFDASKKRAELAKSEELISSPDFWNDSERSQKVMQDRKRLEKAIAEDALCRVLPPGHCTYADGKQPGVFVDIRMTEDDWRRGMDVLESVVAQHVKSLFDAEATPLVDQSTAETRARICASCPANVMIRGCSACMGMANWIVKIRGNAKTESDGVLAQCGVCHCSNKAQVWVKAETLAKGVTPEMLEKFKSLPWCWKGKELSALLSTENP